MDILTYAEEIVGNKNEEEPLVIMPEQKPANTIDLLWEGISKSISLGRGCLHGFCRYALWKLIMGHPVYGATLLVLRFLICMILLGNARRGFGENVEIPTPEKP